MGVLSVWLREDRILCIFVIQKGIDLFKNFLYALYGRPFKAQWLKDYFSKQEWYEIDPEYSDAMIPDFFEKKLIDLVVKQEASLKE